MWGGVLCPIALPHRAPHIRRRAARQLWVGREEVKCGAVWGWGGGEGGGLWVTMWGDVGHSMGQAMGGYGVLWGSMGHYRALYRAAMGLYGCSYRAL